MFQQAVETVPSEMIDQKEGKGAEDMHVAVAGNLQRMLLFQDDTL